MHQSRYERFQSGQTCCESGWYEFDGYLDGSCELLPSLNEMQIPLVAGDTFPVIQNTRQRCYWKLADGQHEQEQEEVRPVPGKV